MGLEDGTGPGKYIDVLNANWPIGGSDDISEGDDHIRVVKNTLINSFPNISGPVSANHTELSYSVGVTGGIQAQIDGKSDSGHTHSEYAPVSHSHTGYSLVSHGHSDYEQRLDALESTGGGEAYTPTPSLIISSLGMDGYVTINPSVEGVMGWMILHVPPSAIIEVYNPFIGQTTQVGLANAQGHASSYVAHSAFLGQSPGYYTFRYYAGGVYMGDSIVRLI